MRRNVSKPRRWLGECLGGWTHFIRSILTLILAILLLMSGLNSTGYLGLWLLLLGGWTTAALLIFHLNRCLQLWVRFLHPGIPSTAERRWLGTVGRFNLVSIAMGVTERIAFTLITIAFLTTSKGLLEGIGIDELMRTVDGADIFRIAQATGGWIAFKIAVGWRRIPEVGPATNTLSSIGLSMGLFSIGTGIAIGVLAIIIDLT